MQSVHTGIAQPKARRLFPFKSRLLHSSLYFEPKHNTQKIAVETSLRTETEVFAYRALLWWFIDFVRVAF